MARGAARWGLPIISLALGGCTVVTVGEGGRSAFYLGAVQVRLPRTEGATAAIEIETFGLGWDRGPYLGWRSGKWVVADPKDCQLLVIIRSPAQAENAAKVMEALGGQKPCIADSTGLLPH